MKQESRDLHGRTRIGVGGFEDFDYVVFGIG